MNSGSIALRNKLYDFIRVADDKKLKAIYHLLENEIEDVSEWWKNKRITNELEDRYNAMEKGKDKGFTLQQLDASVEKLRNKKNDR